MPVYHMALMKLKKDAPEADIKAMIADCHSMVGKIPGLLKIDVGPPNEYAIERSNGYQLACVAILDKPETLPIYAGHPEHTALFRFQKAVIESSMVYDLVF